GAGTTFQCEEVTRPGESYFRGSAAGLAAGCWLKIAGSNGSTGRTDAAAAAGASGWGAGTAGGTGRGGATASPTTAPGGVPPVSELAFSGEVDDGVTCSARSVFFAIVVRTQSSRARKAGACRLFSGGWVASKTCAPFLADCELFSQWILTALARSGLASQLSF